MNPLNLTPITRRRLKAILAATEMTWEEFIAHTLEWHLESLHNGHDSWCFYADGWSFDSLEEAQRITAALDKLDGHNHDRSFVQGEDGRWEEIDYGGYNPPERREIAAAA